MWGLDVGLWEGCSGCGWAGRRARQYCSAARFNVGASVPLVRERQSLLRASDSANGETVPCDSMLRSKYLNPTACRRRTSGTLAPTLIPGMLNFLLPCPRHHAVPRKKPSASRSSKLTLRPVNCARMEPGSGCRSSPFRYWHTCSTARRGGHREELRQKLWPADTFVDFDHSLNTAINKLREALGDSASNPALCRNPGAARISVPRSPANRSGESARLAGSTAARPQLRSQRPSILNSKFPCPIEV